MKLIADYIPILWRRRIRRLIDAAIVLLFLCLVIVPWSELYESRINLMHMLSSPSLDHLLGTDNLGRDLLVRLSEAVRGGVLPLWAGVACGTLAGVLLGIFTTAVARRRRWQPLITGLRTSSTIVVAIPVGVVAFAWAAIQEKAGLWPVMITLSTVFALRTYLQICDLYAHDHRLGFWEAHASLGGSLVWRLLRYGVGGSWRRPLLDAFGFHLRAAVAIEASLSYLGFGLQEPQASFGNMLASHFDQYLKGHGEVLLMIVIVLAITAAFPSCLLAIRAEKRGS